MAAALKALYTGAKLGPKLAELIAHIEPADRHFVANLEFIGGANDDSRPRTQQARRR
jgi:hypothetical protein